MKSSMVLACALALPGMAFASDHGPIFSYATPVNSQGEVSCDAGIFGRGGSKGSQLSTGTGCGYGITPHITANVFLPATFGSGSLPESRIYPGSEWSAGASWRFLHSVTSVGKRIESTASLGVVAGTTTGFRGHLGPSNVRTAGAVLPNSSTTTVWFGPSVLAIFKTVSISAGVQAPVYRDASDSLYAREHVRFAIKFSYLKFSAHNRSH